MQPRVFVSSTYYDLKYVRDRIELFLKRFSFEPVLFESDAVTFEHNKPLDSSCYEEVKLCHMFILIVGGRYGSPSTGHKQEEFQKRYEDEFVSITRKEYETAVKNDMPSFVFIDKSVFAEYLTFKKNQPFFEQLVKDKKIENKEFSFAHVDNQNVFYFIDTLQQKAIKQFDTVDEIEDYLSSQFSGMFFLYLKQLQEKASNQKILDTINELNSVVSRMNTMVDGIGKEVIKHPEDLAEINKKQFKVIAETFSSILFYENIIQFERANFKLEGTQFADIFYNFVLNINVPSNIASYKSSPIVEKKFEELSKFNEERLQYQKKIIDTINLEFQKNHSNNKVIQLDFWSIYNKYNSTVKPFIHTTGDNIDILKSVLDESFYFIPILK